MNLALFDFDGTITHREAFVPFVEFAVPKVRVMLGKAALGPLILAHRLRAISGPQIRQSIAFAAFAGMDLGVLRARGDEFCRTHLSEWVRPRARDRIRWHQTQGDRVVVVSASLEVYLAPWCAAWGTELIGTRLAEFRGRATGRYVGGDCSGTEKSRRVLERYELADYPLVYAYGDTPEDEPLLSLGHRRYYRWQDVSPGS